jgi:mitogen-activated protein kinase kinase kinase
MATSLRAQAQAQTQTHQAQQSPTSSTSSVTTTPTSPHFHTHQRSQSSLARPLGGNGNGNGPYGHVYAQPGTRPSTAPTINHPRPITPELFRPPANIKFAAYLKSWGNEEITDFLSIYNCSHHAGAFQKNDIDGKCILDLDTNNLKEMGVVKVGERIKIHNGIKDLRKRAANSNSGPMGTSRVELRLNGAATPPLEDVPSSSPGLDGLYTRDNHPGSGMRRLGSSRPPPLDLHSQQSRNNLPLAYQNVPTSIEPGATTPRQINAAKDGHPQQPPGPSRNVSSNSTASNVTIVPSQGQASLVPAPAPATRQPQPSHTNLLNLRAPPSRDPGRRSPSPVNTDPTQFIDRPLPPAPNQSSAAEYASAIRYGEARTTPTWGPGGDHQQGSRTQAPNSEGRRHHPPPIIVRQDMSAHRKAPSLGAGTGRSYLGVAPRAATSSGTAIHPFAATTTIHEDDLRGSSPDAIPPPMVSQHSNGSAGSGRSNRNAGYVVGTAGPGPSSMHRSASVISSPHGSTGRRDQSGSGSGTLSLEDLRKQLVKFINSEDGTTRTVNVSSCSSGVEVLERALKKFGKWGTGTAATTDTESDEDGDQLEIDGWGVYEELEYHEDCKCCLLDYERQSADKRRTPFRSCFAQYLRVASRRNTCPRWRPYPPTYPQTPVPKEHGSLPRRSTSRTDVAYLA